MATEYRENAVSEWEDQVDAASPVGTVNPLAFARLIAEIRETARAREDMWRAEQRLILQAKAIQRRLDAAAGDHATIETLRPGVPGAAPVAEGDQRSGDTHISPVSLATLAILHLEEARAPLHAHKLAFERRLEKLAKQLPVWPWVESVRGFGALGLALIIGECGDLSNYDGPAKVWKRMGLAVIEGERQRRVAGMEAVAHGYVPRRRALMWNIGDSLIKGNRDGEYRTCYLERKEYERQMRPDLPDIATHRRAQRYMEKRLLKHLWQAWRRDSVANG